MDDDDDATRGDRIQVLHGHAFGVVVDRIETPGKQRFLRIFHAPVLLPEPFQHLVHVLEFGVPIALRVTASEEAKVGVVPNLSLRSMAVPLNEPRHQHLVRKLLIQLKLSPFLQILKRADTKNFPIPNCHMGSFRQI